MISVANRSSALQSRAAGSRAVPAFAARRAVRVQAVPDPARSDQAGGENATKDLSDVSAPTSLKDVGPAIREAAPVMAPAFEAPLLLPTFSRRREIFAGRLAIVGFASVAAWEIATPGHPGLLSITSSLTGWSLPLTKLVYSGLIAHGLLGLLWPGSPTYSSANKRDYARRPEGPPTAAVNPFTNPQKFFGTSSFWGYTKKNELFVGRMSMIGFFMGLINEMQSGLGPIGQVSWWLGNPTPSDEFYSKAKVAILGFAALVTVIGYATGRAGTVEGEEDIF
ncbi:chloroplast photosystem II-associated protein [Monoraphidium neglectum]|uniref:Chloroplast photosystem II-associated protein n=1 Tax=Monoraphidium neglectum TaxID=145388 RepID=A0A0D2MPH5_9CHLO|nr:chloroplast photosystem II-associated protein [Monoraphidium neglectum]KIZ02412.1 chloroplast photosystem II-associated protein [Monoraphidium neglectum]|eukprot:XP_013901431.1 chloroplast photosystem II-associated protein [Monoraphidium neglectum]